MILVNCKICSKEFHTTPYFLKKGWGKYCSRSCHYFSMKRGENVKCETCNVIVYKNEKQLKNSKSKKYFCSKSCQTVWRNKQYTGQKHKLWKGGYNIKYRSILLAENRDIVCSLCNENDKRVLAVHHVDENRSNNSIKNLAWLCHNCHHLVHHDRLVKTEFLDKLKIQ